MIKSVMIDSVNYNVEVTDETLLVDNQKCGAEVSFHQALIRISNEIGEGAKPRALMHEIFHALLHERGLYDESDNEKLVDELAAGVTNLIRGNSELVEFLIANE